jgi:hypothetical protein
MLQACGQTTPKQNQSQTTPLMENSISKPENPYYSNTDTTKLTLTDAEWKKVLAPDLYAVSRNADTERAKDISVNNKGSKMTVFKSIFFKNFEANATSTVVTPIAKPTKRILNIVL